MPRMKKTPVSTRVICRALHLILTGEQQGPINKFIYRWIGATDQEVKLGIEQAVLSGHLAWEGEGSDASLALTDAGRNLMREWLIVVCKSNFGVEAKVRFNLMDRGFEPWYPESEKAERRGDKTERVRRPIFSRLVFVLREPGIDKKIGRIASCPGVSRMMCSARGDLNWMPDSEFDGIRNRLDQDGVYRPDKEPEKPQPRAWSPGGRVVITKGPFKDQEGTIEGLHLALPNDLVTLTLDNDAKKVKFSIRDADLAVPGSEPVRGRTHPKNQETQRLGA